MAELLLLNPKARRKTRRAPSAAQKRARASFAAASRARSSNPKRRRRNPIAASTVATVRRRVKRRANPIKARSARRRRNPIGSGAKMSVKSFMTMFQDAAVGGAGAVGMDILMGKINPHLPAALQTSATKLGAGDAVKAILTVVIGKGLKKVTRGLSEKAALGALTTQARDIISGFVPASMALAYYSPANIVDGTNRVGPYRPGMGAYQKPGGQTALLNAYAQPGGASQLLSGFRRSARDREGALR